MILKISVTLHYKLLSPITLAPLSLLLLTAALAPPSALLLLTTTLTPTVLLLLTTTMATSVAYCCCYQLLWPIPQHCLLLTTTLVYTICPDSRGFSARMTTL